MISHISCHCHWNIMYSCCVQLFRSELFSDLHLCRIHIGTRFYGVAQTMIHTRVVLLLKGRIFMTRKPCSSASMVKKRTLNPPMKMDGIQSRFKQRRYLNLLQMKTNGLMVGSKLTHHRSNMWRFFFGLFWNSLYILFVFIFLKLVM